MSYSLKQGKSSGPDGINSKVLKELSSELSYPLCELLNSSLSQSIVPKYWKETNYTPIHKTNKTKKKKKKKKKLTHLNPRIIGLYPFLNTTRKATVKESINISSTSFLETKRSHVYNPNLY